MSSPEENLAAARRATEAFRRGDLEQFIAFLDPEVEIFSSPELANPGTFRGREGYRRWSSEWFEAWESFEVEAKAYEPVGECHVLIPVHQRGTGKDSGVEVEMHACYMVEVHDQLATRFHLYPTREQAMDAVRASESGRA